MNDHTRTPERYSLATWPVDTAYAGDNGLFLGQSGRVVGDLSAHTDLTLPKTRSVRAGPGPRSSTWGLHESHYAKRRRNPRAFRHGK